MMKTAIAFGLMTIFGADAQRSGCYNLNSPGGYQFGSVGATTVKAMAGTGSDMTVSRATSTIYATINYSIQVQKGGSGWWSTVYSTTNRPSMVKPEAWVLRSGSDSNTKWRLKMSCVDNCSNNGINLLKIDYCLENLLDVGTTTDSDFESWGSNCNCVAGTRLDDIYVPTATTAQSCAEACKANPTCASYASWTQSGGSVGGHCGLFADTCGDTCADDTATADGYFNEVFNIKVSADWEVPAASGMNCVDGTYVGNVGMTRCKLACEKDSSCGGIGGALDGGDGSCWTCPIGYTTASGHVDYKTVQLPTRTAESDAAAQEAAANEATIAELAGSMWKTGQVGETVYQQNEITGRTFSSSNGNRDQFDLVDAAVAAALSSAIWDNHLEHSVSDGTFTVSADGMYFTHTSGSRTTFPWECSCV